MEKPGKDTSRSPPEVTQGARGQARTPGETPNSGQCPPALHPDSPWALEALVTGWTQNRGVWPRAQESRELETLEFKVLLKERA